MRILATISAPSGLATAIRTHAGMSGLSWQNLFQATGLNADDWAAFQASLDAVNPEHFLRLSTAAGVAFAAGQGPWNARSMGTIGQSYGPSIPSLYGDLR